MKIVTTKGHGPVLNVLHGWGMNAHLFDDWSEQLAQHFQVNLIDLPGHGLNHEETLCTDLVALADEGAEVPVGHWLGWSMGGFLALNLALKKPQLVQSLIMLCATPCFVKRAHWVHGTDQTVLDKFAKNLQLDIKQTIQTFLALEVMGVEHERSQLRELKQKVFGRPLPSTQALNAGLDILANHDLTTELKNLSMPSLWISGRRDRLVIPAAMQQAAELAGGPTVSKYHVLRGSGHAPFIRESETLTQLITDFI